MKRWFRALLVTITLLCLAACAAPQSPAPQPGSPAQAFSAAAPAAATPMPKEEPTPPPAQPDARPEQTPEPAQTPPAGREGEPEQPGAPPQAELLDPDGSYTTREDVALYLHQYGCLPGNFITKKQAQALGWSGGSLEPYAPGMCIGGNRFGNYEGLLPEQDGRTYTECDIDTLGAKSRGAKRIVFSNDGLIYYTDDHYESFTLLYGEETQ